MLGMAQRLTGKVAIVTGVQLHSIDSFRLEARHPY